MAQRWEYKTVWDLTETQTLEPALNELGEQGWELIHLDVTETPARYGTRNVFDGVFKRPASGARPS